MSDKSNLIPPFTLTESPIEETQSETGLELEPFTRSEVSAEPHAIEQGTRIVTTPQVPVPSLFDSATVIKPSMYAETVIHSTKALPEIPSPEVRPPPPPPLDEPPSRPRAERAEKSSSDFSLKKLYFFLNDITSLSHWKGRIVWTSAIGLLIFMIILNNKTADPSARDKKSIRAVQKPIEAKPMEAQVTPPLNPADSRVLSSQSPAPQVAITPKPLAPTPEVSAKVQMKSEFMVRMHELIDKSRSYAP